MFSYIPQFICENQDDRKTLLLCKLIIQFLCHIQFSLVFFFIWRLTKFLIVCNELKFLFHFKYVLNNHIKCSFNKRKEFCLNLKQHKFQFHIFLLFFTSCKSKHIYASKSVLKMVRLVCNLVLYICQDEIWNLFDPVCMSSLFNSP